MITAHTISEVRNVIAAQKTLGKHIGYVATMGALHEGHVSLVNALDTNDFKVMSIFVNRMQFNNADDFNTYPHTLQADCDKARKAGVSLVFAPSENEMFTDRKACVDIYDLDRHLCGAHRPGHFQGVCTVVAKFFNIITPDTAVFGQKDIQQAVILSKMAADLNFNLKIIIAPIVREKSGLAMSSRNMHLSGEEQVRACVLYQALKHAELLIQSGERSTDIICSAMKNIITTGKPSDIDYISVVDFDMLSPVQVLTKKSVIALAVYFGKTRLIDNMIININGDTVSCVY